MKKAKLKKFNATDYFQRDKTHNGIPYVLLNSKGMEIVAKYYNLKYGVPAYTTVSSTDELVEAIRSPEVKKIMKGERDARLLFRVTFLMDHESGRVHSTPVLYIKENNQLGLMYFDSIGLDAEYLALLVSKRINVYQVKDWRPEDSPRKHYNSQRDHFSCHTGALVYFREFTGIDNGQYRMPGLLASIHENATLIEKNLYEVCLPANLLITVQDKRFFEIQQPVGSAVVHKKTDGSQETLTEFLKRYPETADFGEEKKQHQSGYARKKGLKYAHIIEIQFYLDQLEEHLKERFIPELAHQFIASAKLKLNDKPSSNGGNELFKLATNYLNANLECSYKPSFFSFHPAKKVTEVNHKSTCIII